MYVYETGERILRFGVRYLLISRRLSNFITLIIDKESFYSDIADCLVYVSPYLVFLDIA